MTQGPGRARRSGYALEQALRTGAGAATGVARPPEPHRHRDLLGAERHLHRADTGAPTGLVGEVVLRLEHPLRRDPGPGQRRTADAAAWASTVRPASLTCATTCPPCSTGGASRSGGRPR